VFAHRNAAVVPERAPRGADLDDAIGLRIESGRFDVECDELQFGADLAAALPRWD